MTHCPPGKTTPQMLVVLYILLAVILALYVGEIALIWGLFF